MLKKIDNILPAQGIIQRKGPHGLSVHAIQSDSRNIRAQDCFVALAGTKNDGHNFIATAIEKGAHIIVCEHLPAQLNDKILYLQVGDSAQFLGELLARFYDEQDAPKMAIIGVTGTNGKTSIATLLYQLFTALGHKAGLISTVETITCGVVSPSTHTTPDSVSLHATLHAMRKAGCTHVFMECSSHAGAQKRLAGVALAGCVFTNITHDHLDYHETFQNYLDAKKSFFDALDENAFALVNKDDAHANYMLQNTRAQKKYYALKTMCEFKGKVLANNFDGLVMLIGKFQTHLQLIGKHNAYNALAVYATALLLGVGNLEVLTQLSLLRGARGRFDVLHIKEGSYDFFRVIDYAHTPDALEKTLKTAVAMKGTRRLITMCGCGGNRDKTKRPMMAAIAVKYSDLLILTSDNPRDEAPEDILADMLRGLQANKEYKKTKVIEDRKQAIETAISFAHKGDIILIAGKGHEMYQERAGVKIPFDEVGIVADYVGRFRDKSMRVSVEKGK